MTVAELIESLGKMPQDAHVMLWDGGDDFHDEGYFYAEEVSFQDDTTQHGRVVIE